MTALKLTYTLQAGLVAQPLKLDFGMHWWRSELCRLLKCQMLGCIKVFPGITAWYDNWAAERAGDFILTLDDHPVGNHVIFLGTHGKELPMQPAKLAELLEITNKLLIRELEYA